MKLVFNIVLLLLLLHYSHETEICNTWLTNSANTTSTVFAAVNYITFAYHTTVDN